MVQLKVGATFTKGRSSPFQYHDGAIKSMFFIMLIFILNYFNTTMVQLKAVLSTIKNGLVSRLYKNNSLSFMCKKSSVYSNTINTARRRPAFYTDYERFITPYVKEHNYYAFIDTPTTTRSDCPVHFFPSQQPSYPAISPAGC